MANNTGTERPQAHSPQCSFCGKREHEGVRLVAGPRAYICNECVALCVDIFAGDFTKVPGHKQQMPLKDRMEIFKKGQEKKE